MMQSACHIASAQFILKRSSVPAWVSGRRESTKEGRAGGKCFPSPVRGWWRPHFSVQGGTGLAAVCMRMGEGEAVRLP